MSLESQYVPMNGKEGIEAIIREFTKQIKLMPMMKEGHSYHRFGADVRVVISAFPKDTPVPEADFKFLINASTSKMPETFADVVEQVKYLEGMRENLTKRMERLDATLQILRPQEELKVELRAGDKPDELRLAQDMPIPMIKRTGSSITEVRVPAAQVKVGK